MKSLLSRLREKIDAGDFIRKRVSIEGVEIGLIDPPTIELSEIQDRARIKAEEKLLRLHGEAKLKRLKNESANTAAEEARQKEAQEKGVEILPYVSEYERILDNAMQSYLLPELVPIMVVDPETGELLAKQPEDVKFLQTLLNQNVDFTAAISEVMMEYGKRLRAYQGNGQAKKKPAKK